MNMELCVYLCSWQGEVPGGVGEALPRSYNRGRSRLIGACVSTMTIYSASLSAVLTSRARRFVFCFCCHL